MCECVCTSYACINIAHYTHTHTHTHSGETELFGSSMTYDLSGGPQKRKADEISKADEEDEVCVCACVNVYMCVWICV
jgi:hypothetical protein